MIRLQTRLWAYNAGYSTGNVHCKWSWNSHKQMVGIVHLCRTVYKEKHHLLYTSSFQTNSRIALTAVVTMMFSKKLYVLNHAFLSFLNFLELFSWNICGTTVVWKFKDFYVCIPIVVICFVCMFSVDTTWLRIDLNNCHMLYRAFFMFTHMVSFFEIPDVNYM